MSLTMELTPQSILVTYTHTPGIGNIFTKRRMRIKKKTLTTISILLVVAVLALLLFSFLSRGNSSKATVVGAEITSNVLEENGLQIIEVISTAGGYSPRKITAKSDIPTVLRLNSENSYGCERSFRIPSLNITEILPTQGVTEIDLGVPQAGKNIFGTCSMGMYTFTISFI